MKNVLKRSLSVFLALAIIFSSAYVGLGEIDFSELFAVKANAASVNDLTFKLNDDGVSYSVTDCKTSISGGLVIPDTYKGKPVTNIGYEAFKDCTRLTGVTIPDSVTSIGWSAFYDCDSLTSVTIPDSVANITESAFYNCTRLTSVYITDIAAWCNINFSGYSANPLCCKGGDLYLNNEPITSLVVPDGVTSIGDWTFYNCTSLTSVTIPDSVTSIGSRAFYNTTYYNNSTNWENGVLYICNHLIEAEEFLSGSYEIKPGTKTIANSAFGDCTSLTSIIIPDSVTSIGVCAFSLCENLKSVAIPNSVTTIGTQAFYGCGSLVSVVLPDSITNIASGVFLECGSLKAITIPDSVTSIGDSAFEFCWSLSSVELPDNLMSIGDAAFACTNLASITIPDSATSIGDWVFNVCENLTSVSIGNGVTTIGADAFSDCVNLKDLYIGNDYVLSQMDFSDFPFLESVVLGEGVTSIENFAFERCDSLISITIPESVTSIGHCAFQGCTGLKAITIPNNLTCIKNSTFSDCTSLTSITIPDSVTSIDDDAFYGCTGLTSIEIPDGVESIGLWAFQHCTNLTSIIIPDSVKNIWDDAFSGTGYYNDESNWENDVLYIGNHLIKAKSSLSEEYIIKEGTKTIAGSVFYDCTNLTSVIIPDSVTNIGNDAFRDCTKLKSIIIPDGVITIGYGAFQNCNNLDSIALPHSVTSIGSYAFENCNGLEYVFYAGLESDWANITIGSHNELLTNAIIHYNSKGHCYPNDWTIDKAATCTATGLKYKKCTVCGETLENETIPVIGHSYSDWTITKEPTCTENGSKHKSCSVCGDVVTETAEAFGHNYATEWTIDTAPTCTTNGSKSHHCSICDKKADVTTIAALSPETGCLFGLWQVETEPTCTSEGIQSRMCSVCGSEEETTISRLPHITSDWIITLKPTCTGEGLKEKKCTICDTVLKSSTIFATGHTYGETETITSATCTENGTGKHSCIDCGITEYVSIPSTHTYEWITDTEATVNAAGSKHKECTVCGKTLEKVTIKQLKCSKPTIKTIANKDYGVRFEWKAVSGADSYKVYRKVSGGSYKYLGTTTKTAYADKTAKSGTKYYYVVKAVNEAGSSEKSSSKSITFVGTPTIKTPSSAKSGITVKWSKVSGAEGYIVYRKTGSGSYERLAKIKGSTKVSYLDKSAKKGKTYSYKMFAYKGSTKSAASSVKTIKDKY